MNPRYREAFYTSAGLLLLAMSAFGLLGNLQHPALQPLDAVLGISSSYVFWTLALLEACIAAFCFFGQSSQLKNSLLLWFSSSILFYGFSQFLMSVKTLNAFYYSIAISFGLGIKLLGVFHAFALFYLLLGGLLCVFRGAPTKIPTDKPDQDANECLPPERAVGIN